ncbi:hypothetical protein ACF06V_31310 [Streptomyces bobili]|uniref:hypothetical protein n=1 Tax=Streptomyces bobili TaxID=67280 RepID=UPI0036FBED93
MVGFLADEGDAAFPVAPRAKARAAVEQRPPPPRTRAEAGARSLVEPEDAGAGFAHATVTDRLDAPDSGRVPAGHTGQFSLRAWQAAAYLAVQMSDAL